MRIGRKSRFWVVFLVAICFSFIAAHFTACSSREGWGVLLWATEDPPVLSGTVLPVYIRSNIDKVWILGLPGGSSVGGADRVEVPFSRFEFVGSKSKAQKRADALFPYARTYAENIQNGLPVRDNPDNNARRVYRLRTGEIVKILSIADGVPAIGATGEPLPGDWYRVLTEDGSTGFCFSYRLKLFEHNDGPLAASVPADTGDHVSDPDLDMVLSETWYPESYSVMIESERIDFEELSKRRRFDPGQDTGIARVFTSDVDRSFTYNGIRPDGTRAWRFEGTSLYMQLRSDSLLAVQYIERSGSLRNLLFVSLPIDMDELLTQENARRALLFNAIYSRGPVFTSSNFGTVAFGENGSFTWTGYDLLVPHLIPESANGRGTIAMDIFLDPEFETLYMGAFTMRFTGNNRREVAVLRCMYSIDDQGFRIEVVPESSIEEVTVTSRAVSPMIIYFFSDTVQDSPQSDSPQQ